MAAEFSAGEGGSTVFDADRNSPTLTALASMAVHPLVTAAVQETGADQLPHIEFHAVGGVDAARRVAQGEVCDLVVLAHSAVDRLVKLGHLAAESARPLAASPAAVAVAQGASHPRIDDEEDLRRALEHAETIAYSTGPSGDGLVALLERWGVREALWPRLVQTAPGQPVGALLVTGRAEIGIQQFSELIHHPGVDVLGLLPPGCEVLTTFTGAATTRSWRDARRRPATDAVLAHLAAPALAPLRARFGLLEPAPIGANSGASLQATSARRCQ